MNNAAQSKRKREFRQRYFASKGFQSFAITFIRWINYLVLIPICAVSAVLFLVAKHLYGVDYKEPWLQGLLMLAVVLPLVILVSLRTSNDMEQRAG